MNSLWLVIGSLAAYCFYGAFLAAKVALLAGSPCELAQQWKEEP